MLNFEEEIVAPRSGGFDDGKHHPPNPATKVRVLVPTGVVKLA